MTKDIYIAAAQSGFVLPDGDYEGFLRSRLGDLGSPDPQLRDDLAFSAFWTWILQGKIGPEALASLVDTLCSDAWLFDGIGSKRLGLAVRRTFSALLLSTVLEYDNQADTLSRGRVEEIHDRIGAYMLKERVTAGYSGRLGWIHAFAHGADVLRELLKSPKLDEARKSTIPDLILRSLSGAAGVFQFGEDERFCQAIFSYRGGDAAFISAHLDKLIALIETKGTARMATARNLIHYLKSFLVFARLLGDPVLSSRCESQLRGLMPEKWSAAP